MPITEFRYRMYRAIFVEVDRALQEARGGVVYSSTTKNMMNFKSVKNIKFMKPARPIYFVISS